MEDREIMELYRSGEERQAFNLIVRKYKERLYWHIRNIVCIHEDADDLLQNTFIKVWNNLDSFREDAKLYIWIYRIATNEVITFLNKKKLYTFLSFDRESATFENKLKADPTFNGDETQLALRKAINSLPPKQKSVFCMRYFGEKKYEEIAEIMNTSEGSLKASYHHAYKKVVDYLKDNIDLSD